MNPSPRQLELIEEVRRLQNVTVEALAEGLDSHVLQATHFVDQLELAR